MPAHKLYGLTENFAAMPRALPLGELSPKVTERARTVKCANAIARYDPSCENGAMERPQAFHCSEIKIILPLSMRKANAERILNHEIVNFKKHPLKREREYHPL